MSENPYSDAKNIKDWYYDETRIIPNVPYEQGIRKESWEINIVCGNCIKIIVCKKLGKQQNTVDDCIIKLTKPAVNGKAEQSSQWKSHKNLFLKDWKFYSI